MKERWEKIRKRFYIEDISQRMILFNIIVPILIVSGIISFIASIFSKMPVMQQVAVIFAIVVLLVGFYLANWRNHLNLGAFIISASVTLVLYPIMFFTGGGAESGMGYWMVLGILFSFVLIDGMLFRVLLPVQVITVLACFAVEYFYPNTVASLNSRMSAYIDIVQSMINLSVCVGMIFRFENKFYQRTFREIRQKNEEIRLAKQHAEKASNAKSIFLSNVSHELRTPLDSILQMNEGILQQSTDETILQMAAQIQEAAEVLQLDINNILDITQIESGKLEPTQREYQVERLILDCYHSVYRHVRNKNLKLVFEYDENLPCALYGDMQHIRQVWINMIIGAAKCMQSGTVYTRIEGQNQNYKFQLQLYVTATDVVRKQLKENESIQEDANHGAAIDEDDMEWNLTQRITLAMNGIIHTVNKGNVELLAVDIPQYILNDRPIGQLDIKQQQENGISSITVQNWSEQSENHIQSAQECQEQTEIKETPLDSSKEGGFLETISHLIEEFDVDKALLYCAGDEELLQEMIIEFTRAERITEIEQLFAAGDWKNYQIRIHSLKSTSLTLGFIRLHEEAKTIETAVKTGNIQYVQEHHDACMRHYQMIIQNVENIEK